MRPKTNLVGKQLSTAAAPQGCEPESAPLLMHAADVLDRLYYARERLARIDRRLVPYKACEDGKTPCDSSLAGRLHESRQVLSFIEEHLAAIEKKLLGTNYAASASYEVGAEDECREACCE